MADSGSPSHGTGLEPRVARLEADVAEIKSILNRLAPRIDEIYGFVTAKLPELSTKAELAELRTETKTGTAALRTELKTEIAELRTETKTEIAALRTELKSEIAELRIEIMQRQTVFDIFSIVSPIGIILAVAARFAH
jgi:hypothetical protein